MNYVCAISNTLIKKSDRVRVFFIRTREFIGFPFMNQNSPTSTGNFVPLGVAFEAKFIDDEHNETFEFKADKKKPKTRSVLLDYIEKNKINKSVAKENNLLSHWSKNKDWGKITSLESLFEDCIRSAVILEKNKKGEYPFVSVMVVHESVYQLVMENFNISKSLLRYENEMKKENVKNQKAFYNKFMKKEREELTAKMGKMDERNKTEEVIVDDEIIAIILKELDFYEDRVKDQETIDFLEEEKKKILSSKGQLKTLNLTRERIVDQAYIEEEINDFKRLSLGREEDTAFKKAATNANSDNYLASEQVNAVICDRWLKPHWIGILEVYIMETFLTYNGYEFKPSRRHYPYQDIRNKEFLKSMSDLKVCK